MRTEDEEFLKEASEKESNVSKHPQRKLKAVVNSSLTIASSILNQK